MLIKPDSFDSPSESGTVPALQNYIQPTLGHGLRVWWAYYWPTSLISIVILGFSTVLLRKAWENGMLSGHAVAWADRIIPFLVVYSVSVPTIRYVLGKSFRSFRVALLPRNLSSSAEVLPASFRRSIRVWWEFSWRAVVYSVIVRFAGSIALSLTLGILSSLGRLMAALVPIAFQVVIDGAVGLFVVYSAILDEEYGDFRVALLPRNIVSPGAPVPAPNAIPQ